MLAYERSHHIPVYYAEQHFDHEKIDNGRIYTRRDGSSAAIDRLRTPLLELKNSCSPLSQKTTYFDVSHRYMQSYPGPSQRFNSEQSSQSGFEHHIMAQDSGLGIMTEENMFDGSYQVSGAHQAPYLSYHRHTGSEASDQAPQLASPFDEERTSAMRWNTHPGDIMSDGYQTAYAFTPDHHLLTPDDGQSVSQYAMSPADFTPDSLQHGNVQNAQFKMPMMRHTSASSGVPQTSNLAYATPTVEASPFQWTPQSATPESQDATQYAQYSSNMPPVMLDYSICSSEDQGSQPPQPQQGVRTVMTMPQRGKPHLRPSLSESCVPRISSPVRMRATTMGQFLQAPPYYQYANQVAAQQLPLPPLPPSVLINTPQMQRPGGIITGNQAQSHRHSRSCSNTSARRKRPSSPPPSDFSNTHMPYLVPIRQEPTFSGDLYTPRYKRRTSNGRWEGWCGYCQPGRWLDLKNSRFWEDKLRNHGICAKTKMRFAEPEKIRWVTADGSVIPEDGLGPENNDPFLEQKKREGLCGTCKTWVGMDGLRTKARDRAVGWWMHAYKVSPDYRAVKREINPFYSAMTMIRS